MVCRGRFEQAQSLRIVEKFLQYVPVMLKRMFHYCNTILRVVCHTVGKNSFLLTHLRKTVLELNTLNRIASRNLYCRSRRMKERSLKVRTSLKEGLYI